MKNLKSSFLRVKDIDLRRPRRNRPLMALNASRDAWGNDNNNNSNNNNNNNLTSRLLTLLTYTHMTFVIWLHFHNCILSHWHSFTLAYSHTLHTLSYTCILSYLHTLTLAYYHASINSQFETDTITLVWYPLQYNKSKCSIDRQTNQQYKNTPQETENDEWPKTFM